MAQKQSRCGMEKLTLFLKKRWCSNGCPEMETLILLANELNISLDDLVSGKSTAIELPRQGISDLGTLELRKTFP